MEANPSSRIKSRIAQPNASMFWKISPGPIRRMIQKKRERPMAVVAI
jgi:hypothetical protein